MAHSELLAMLKANMGKPITASLAADICMAADGRAREGLTFANDFGSAAHDGVTFQVEAMWDCLDEIKALHSQHWGETEGYRGAEGFKPDYEQYVAIDREGAFLLVTARAGTKMVGYFMSLLYRSRHSSKMVAGEDGFFLLPDYRRGWTLMKMMRFNEACLRKLGMKQLTLSEKLTNPIGPVLTRAGFTYCGNLWTKVF